MRKFFYLILLLIAASTLSACKSSAAKTRDEKADSELSQKKISVSPSDATSIAQQPQPGFQQETKKAQVV